MTESLKWEKRFFGQHREIAFDRFIDSNTTMANSNDNLVRCIISFDAIWLCREAAVVYSRGYQYIPLWLKSKAQCTH